MSVVPAVQRCTLLVRCVRCAEVYAIRVPPQGNTMTLGKLVIKCPRKPREDLCPEGLLQILPRLEGTFNH